MCEGNYMKVRQFLRKSIPEATGNDSKVYEKDDSLTIGCAGKEVILPFSKSEIIEAVRQISREPES